MSVPLTAPSTATEVQTSATPTKTHPFSHPLDPLTPDEVSIAHQIWRNVLIRISDLSQIVAVTHSVRRHVAEKTEIKAVRFITCYLLPPTKKAVLAFLGIPLQSGEKPEPAREIVRKAEVDVSVAINASPSDHSSGRFLRLVRGCRHRVSAEVSASP